MNEPMEILVSVSLKQTDEWKIILHGGTVNLKAHSLNTGDKT